MVLLDEGGDFFAGFWVIHALAVPGREEGTLDEGVQGDLAERIAVGPLQEAFAIDFFCLNFLGYIFLALILCF